MANRSVVRSYVAVGVDGSSSKIRCPLELRQCNSRAQRRGTGRSAAPDARSKFSKRRIQHVHGKAEVPGATAIVRWKPSWCDQKPRRLFVVSATRRH